MIELSILIPSRNEMFLVNTIEDALKQSRADTEIIAVLDGEWANPAVPQHPRVNVFHTGSTVGMRAATNYAAKIAKGRYLMKVDAHCAFDEGFDQKMLEFHAKVGDNVTSVPIMRNLWAFDWKCMRCGFKQYQGPTPGECPSCKNPGKWKRKMIWKGKSNPQSTSYHFDAEPHFGYFNEYRNTNAYKLGTILGYRLRLNLGGFPSDSLADIGSLPLGRVEPSLVRRVINLLADFAGAHQFAIFPHGSGFWKSVTENAVSLPAIYYSGGVGGFQIGAIRDETQMQWIATAPVLTDVVNYGYVPASAPGDWSYHPGVHHPVNEGFLVERGHATISPNINSSDPVPAAGRVLHSDVVDKLSHLFGGEFVYNKKFSVFHNGIIDLIPVHCNKSTETMSLQGSCFMCSKDMYWRLNLSDEMLGNWGNQGIEVAAKTWLSGGRVLVNHATWYAHMFRTQGGDFSFPYALNGVQSTKRNVKKILWETGFEGQKYPISWLVEKFWPVPGWTEEQLAKLRSLNG